MKTTTTKTTETTSAGATLGTTLETLPISLLAGTVTTTETNVVYQTADGRGRATFPFRAEAYLRRFTQGCDIEQLIIETQSRGQAVDYRLLKTLIVGLYHGGCLKNPAQLRPFLESWNQPPLQEPFASWPFSRTRASEMDSGVGVEVFLAAAAAFLIGVSLVFGLRDWGLPPGGQLFITLLFLPSVLFSSLALLQSLLGFALGHRRFRLGARVSPFGVHFEADSRLMRAHPMELLLVTLAGSLLLPAVAWSVMSSLFETAPGAVRAEAFTRGLSLAMVALGLLPGLKTAMGHARAGLHQQSRPDATSVLIPVFLALSALGIFVALTFALQATAGLLGILWNIKYYVSFLGLSQVFFVIVSFGWAVALTRDVYTSLEKVAEDFTAIDRVRAALSTLVRNLTVRRAQLDRERLAAEFSRHVLFQMLPREFRNELLDNAELIRAGRGSRLVRQGSRSTDLFLLLKGSAGVYRREGEVSKQAIQLAAGSIFGEAGFFLDERRTADVITLEDSEIVRIRRPLRMNRTEVEAAFVADVFRKKIWASQALASSSLFRDLPPEAILHILNFSDVITLQPNTTFIREGEGSDALWICVQGESAVTVKQVSRPSIHKGNVLGEIGLIWNTPRTATITTTTESVFLKLSAPAFRRLLSRNLHLAAHLQELGAERLEADRNAA